MLNQSEIQELFNIIKKNSLFYIASQLGKHLLLPEDKIFLKSKGIDLSKIKSVLSPIEQAYIFGHISTLLENKVVKKMDFNDFKRYLKSDNWIPLVNEERAAIQSLEQFAYNEITGLGNKQIQKLMGKVIEFDQKLKDQQIKTIKDKSKEALFRRENKGWLASELREHANDWSRDWGRVADYIMTYAYSKGSTEAAKKRDGENAKVWMSVYNQACKYCIKSYLTAGIGSRPKVFLVSELEANGSNIGRKADETLPIIPPHHPNCFDKETEVLTNQGWKLFKDLNHTEKYLSVDLESGNAEWLNAINYISYQYKGKMHLYENKNFSSLTTPNHHHVIKTYHKPKLRLVETMNLPVSSKFLKTIPNWKGHNKINFKFDDISFDVQSFIQFMGYFISEGCVIKYKNETRLHISQSKEKYQKEIYIVCKKLFKTVSLCKDYIQVGISTKKNKELIEYLSLGKSWQKYIPENIKRLNKELIEIFLFAFCQGDGNFIKGKMWDGYQCKDSRQFFTSSHQLASDLGELILKIGKVPSYTFKEPQTIYDPKRQKSYTQNHGIWWINETTSRFAHKESMRHKEIPYDDYVYDVELEKYHTLFVRRNGKVCVSGNCRCDPNRYIPGSEWDETKGEFKEKPYKSKYEPLVKVKINGKEYQG